MTARSQLAEWPLPAFQLNNSLAVVDQSLEAELLFGKTSDFLMLLDEGSREKAQRLMKQSGDQGAVELNFVTEQGLLLADSYFRWNSEFTVNVVIVPKDDKISAIATQLMRLRGRLRETDYELLQEKERADALLEKVRKLSAPCIKIGGGYVLIPLFGDLDLNKVEAIRPYVVDYIYENGGETVILDLTAMGTVTQDGVDYLDSLVQTLCVMGIDTIVTGVKPQHAKKMHLLKAELNLRFESSLEVVLNAAQEKK
jgi:rsbT co-antagonist protein RsbR